MKLFLLVVLVYVFENSLIIGDTQPQKWGGTRWSDEEYKKLKDTVAKGARAGIRECERQFRLNKWNCTVSFNSKQLPIFVRSSLPFANRETAFLHAISTAGVTYWLIKRCRQNELKGCHCAGSKCNDDFQFGANLAKHFIDALETDSNSRSILNKHNNEVGRQAVKASLKKRCRCHGVTGSCQTQTCSQRIGEMEEIGDYLKKRFRYAKVARFSEGKLQFKTKKGFRFVGARNYPMLYLVPSPNYCEKNLALGSPGVLGRMCPQNKTQSAECTNLCRSCGLWPRTVVQQQTANCHCKFFWCCRVKCSSCTKNVIRMVCQK